MCVLYRKDAIVFVLTQGMCSVQEGCVCVCIDSMCVCSVQEGCDCVCVDSMCVFCAGMMRLCLY